MCVCVRVGCSGGNDHLGCACSFPFACGLSNVSMIEGAQGLGEKVHIGPRLWMWACCARLWPEDSAFYFCFGKQGTHSCLCSEQGPRPACR